MKVYLVKRPASGWCQDYAMVIIAQDERHAERKATLLTIGNKRITIYRKVKNSTLYIVVI